MSSNNENDIYADLQTFDFSKELQMLMKDNESLKSKLRELKEQNVSLIEKSQLLEKQNLNLENNISSLFKTATSEVERKNVMIKELQKQVDSLKINRMARPNPISQSLDPQTIH